MYGHEDFISLYDNDVREHTISMEKVVKVVPAKLMNRGSLR